MYTKWLVAVFVSVVGLALVSSQSETNVTNGTTEAPNVTITTSTTKLPVTTTVAPTTSTVSPTTTPHSTTTAAPTVPPTPPPKPAPESWNGTVSGQNGTCINVKFSVGIDISYNSTKNTILTTGFIIPTNASVDESNSHCNENGSETQVLTIQFVNEEHTSANLTLLFNKTTDNEPRVQSIKLSFNLTQDLFPQFHDSELYGSVVTFEKDDLALFKVASAHSYVCSAVQSADLGSHEKGINDVTIDFTDSQVEAYIGKSNKGAFDSEIDCKSSEISDVVPIAVGAALAGLVVIVLIAYFIGRRRSRRLAYQSV